MGYVLSILMNALQTWLYTKLWDSFFTRRFNGKQFWAYWVIWTAAITVLVNILPNDSRYSYAVGFVMELVLFYGMCLTLYCGRWDRRLFVVITSYACFFSIAVLTEKAWLLYSGMTQTEYVYNKPLYTAFLFLRWLCIMAFVILVWHSHTPPKENGKPRAWILASTLFPLCTLFVLYRVFNAESAAGENDAYTSSQQMLNMMASVISNNNPPILHTGAIQGTKRTSYNDTSKWPINISSGHFMSVSGYNLSNATIQVTDPDVTNQQSSSSYSSGKYYINSSVVYSTCDYFAA